MIYDCFLYSGEAPLLELRRAELAPLNVQHVLVASETTFTNKPNINPIPHCEPNLHVGIFPSSRHTDPWRNEAEQRDHIKTVLLELRPADNDIIIVSDVDEIPRTSAIAQYRPEMGICALEMDVNWFYLNTRNERRGWRIAKIMPWSYLKNTTPQTVRDQGTPLLLAEAGTHYSWQGGPQAIETKFRSFSHQEEGIRERILGTLVGDIVPDSELPLYVRENLDKFKHMILR